MKLFDLNLKVYRGLHMKKWTRDSAGSSGFFCVRRRDFIDRVPVDPFDDKPLTMKALRAGVDLYSVSASQASPDLKSDPIHFYLGREAYNELRVKPETEARLKKETQDRAREAAKKVPGVKQ